MYEQGVTFRQALAELEDCFSAGYHIKHVDDIFQRVFGRSE
jgi:adenylosuccinate lyase